jgi:hypothetical protein
MNLSTPCGIALVVAATVLPHVAGAQEAPLPSTTTTTTTRDTTSSTTGPTLWMIETGLANFAFAYIPVVVVGATSGLAADRNLLVPLAGPWIDLTQRPACSPASTCSTESSAKALLVFDGVFQAIGAFTVVGGFLITHETPAVRGTASSRPALRVSPAQIGTSGYGVVALASF